MTKFFRVVFVAAFFSSLALSAQAYELYTKKKILDNGLTVVVTEMPSSPFVSVYALTKTGSATESPYLGSGLSHFLEHMLFKGTERRPVGRISQEIQAVGGVINASTSFDYTIYTIDVPYDKFDTGLDVLEDMTMHSLIDPAETEKEREVIMGEMRMRNDNPGQKLSNATFANVYQKHPYRHPIIGYPDLFHRASREELWAYYKDRYVPNNMVVSIAGSVDADEAIAKVEQVFGKDQRSHELMSLVEPEPQQIQMRHAEIEYPTEKSHLSLAYASVPLLDADLYALDVLAGILGSGESSRLYEELYRKKDLVYSIVASNYTPNDRGAFEVECELEYENMDKTIQAIKEQIDLVKSKGVSPRELAKVKKSMKANRVFGMKVSSSVAYSHAMDEALTGDFTFSEKYVDRVQDVTLKDIQRVAQKYLIDSGLSITVLKPAGMKNEERSSEQAQSSAVEKFVLDNGLTVLLREDHSIPLVSLLALMSGGVRFETKENNGTYQVLSRTWTKGTKKLNAQQIATFVEENGISLEGQSGRSSLYLTMEMLTDDFSKGFDLFYDLLTQPVFDDGEIKLVKDELLQEIKNRKDSIFAYTTDEMERNIFEGHPYSMNSRGTGESLKDIGHSEVAAVFKEQAVVSNMIVAVFGDITKDDALELVKKKFGSWPKGERRSIEHSLSERAFLRKDMTLDKEQAMVVLGFQAPGFNNSDKITVDVLTDIMGSSFSGRMFTKIRDKLGHAYTLGGYFAPMLEAGQVQFYVLTSEDSVDQVIDLIKKEIKDIQSNGVSPQELEEIKTYMKGTYKNGNQANDALILTSSLDEFYGDGFDRYTKYDQLIDVVTADDVKAMARKYLDLDKAAIVVTHSKKSPDTLNP